MTKKQLEKKYGITIKNDSFMDPMTGRNVRSYKMYSADGCPWEKGLRSIKAIEEECRRYGNSLLRIKAAMA